MENEITTVTRLWDRQPNETPKAYAAFCIYRDAPLFGEDGNKRTADNVARKLGLKTSSGIWGWSSKYNWIERVTAYDIYKNSVALTVKEVGIKELQEATNSSLSMQLSSLNDIINKKLNALRDDMNSGDPDKVPDVGTLKKMAETIRQKDDLARRLAEMPTNYITQTVDAPDNEEQIYIIGAE